MHPYIVLLVAILLPGVGQLLNRMPQRALTFAFFVLSLGWITYNLTTPEQSPIGRYAGGIFIHGFAVIDAYRWARLRWATRQQSA